MQRLRSVLDEKIGRDIGILYGLMAGVIVFVMLLFLYQKLMTMV